MGLYSFTDAVNHMLLSSGEHLVNDLNTDAGVDTSVAHLAGAMGRPTWIPLTKFAVDWRWQVNTDLSPWYPSARLFRQPEFGDWASVFETIKKYLSFFKI